MFYAVIADAHTKPHRVPARATPFVAHDGGAARPVGRVPDEHADGLGSCAGGGLAESDEGVEGGAQGDVVHQEACLSLATARSAAQHMRERCVAHRAHSSAKIVILQKSVSTYVHCLVVAMAPFRRKDSPAGCSFSFKLFFLDSPT